MIRFLLLALLGSTAPSLPQGAGKRTELAVVVHPDNSSTSVTRRELENIFKVETRFWPEGGRIALLLPKSGSPAKGWLLENIYKQTERELKRYWLQLVFQNKIPEVPKVLPSTAVTLAFVSKRKEAVGIVPVGGIDEDAAVRIVQVDGRKPGDEGYWLVTEVDEEDEQVWAPGLDEGGQRKLAASEFVALVPAAAARANQADDESRIQRLEDELADLRDRVELADEEDDGLFGPLLRLRGFTDVTYSASEIDRDPPGTDIGSNQFALGQFDLFITSELSERLSALSETVFTGKSDGSTATSVERAILKYSFTDSLNVQAGRFHTTLGHWNEAYHHGEWFHTTIGRPQIVNYGGQGGVLPIHLIGLVLKGRTDVSTTGLDYTLEVGNGRAPTRGPDQIVADANEPKAVNMAIGIRPGAVDGLRIGGGVYLDEIPSNTNAAAGPVHGSLDETILSGFATYFSSGWEVLAEYYSIQHEGGAADPDTDSTGFYVQLGRRLDRWTPYLRYEGLDIDDASTYFENRSDQERYLLGARWDFHTWSALKAQVAYTEVASAPGGSDEDRLEFAVQWSYTF